MALRPAEAGLLVVHVLLSVGGLLLIKTQASQLKLAWQRQDTLWPMSGLLALGAACYIGGFLIWMIVLARNELSVVYPIAVGATLALSSIAAAMLLGETLSLLRLAGIACIMLGVVVIVRS
ncbi:hypothetical protein [Roseococcus sp.]|uniref:hypothetical protein n=1 Tax=Roseococcus sp. TaxID=2109646 RepID=UPI003BAA22A0